VSVFLQIDANPNCDALDGMIFQPKTEPRAVRQLRCERGGTESWWDVTGVEEGPQWNPAMACMVDDSGDGACYLVYGGGWGMRLREPSSEGVWDLEARAQWGAQYFLLAGDGSDLRFL
jgi:hypothetical protein